ncbi:ABC transporter permease [Halorussus marinus]|uniref:ABC transporter permease n=1 Tax=Halorussus marinus TaxID=2505976 RepID=UPI00106ED9B8|nr:ABC transporter permease [Halorussus marinus]
MKFRTYLVRRLVAMAVTFWGILTLVFVIARVVPGNPAAVIAGSKATEEQIAQIRETYGLDDPLHEQYVDFIVDLVLHQDLGMSIATQRPVAQEIAQRFPATFELTTLAVVFALTIGIPLGIASAIHKDEPVDHGSRLVAISGVSIPQFWIAILAQLFFYYQLGWLPSGGRFTSQMTPPPNVTGLYLVDSLLALDFGAFVTSFTHLLLPAAVLSLGTLAQTTRIMRSSMIETLNTDYIEWSRAHGFRSRIILLRHALRNAVMPTITAVGLSYGLLLGGSVVIEIVFNIRGLGLFLYNAVISTDFNGILGVTIVFALGYLIVNFVVDVLHSYINPEVELGE